MNYEQAKYGLLGLLVGDALGVPYEFTRPTEIPDYELIEYEAPEDFHKAYDTIPPGTWSDDGAQALCVLDSLLKDGKRPVRIEDSVGERLLRWYREGFMAVDGKVFDIGNTTRNALERFASGYPGTESGLVGENTQANGSLMRTLPIAFVPENDNYLCLAAAGQSRVTHAHPIPVLCCAVYVIWARRIAEGHEDPWNAAFDMVIKDIPPTSKLRTFVNTIRSWKGPVMGTGYVIDALHSAKYALDKGTDYESTVRHAILLGHDTDTTACIAGGLAGIKYQSIPERWLSGLRGREILDPILEEMRSLFTPSA